MIRNEFIETIAPIIKKEATKRGYKICSIIIAQAILESGYGKSLLASKYHNYFGMKCGKYWKGKSVNLNTKEEYNGKVVNITDNFRVYDSMDSGVVGYFDFISTSRYKKLKKAKNHFEYANFIKECGYATSSSYVTSLIKLVNLYDLTEYDIKDDFKFNSVIADEVIDGLWGDGEDRKIKLTKAGYNYETIQAIVNEKLKG